MSKPKTIGDALRSDLADRMQHEPDGRIGTEFKFETAIGESLRRLGAQNCDREAEARTLAALCNARKVYFETRMGS